MVADCSHNKCVCTRCAGRRLKNKINHENSKVDVQTSYNQEKKSENVEKVSKCPSLK